MSTFADSIQSFNTMYRLPTPAEPTLGVLFDPIARLKAFRTILLEEIEEFDEVLALLENGGGLTALTALADLLGDIQVYCASEMAKFGLPLDAVLTIIMDSNHSKLGADGLPIYDERGKMQKGPGYWKPEPAIAKMLASLIPE